MKSSIFIIALALVLPSCSLFKKKPEPAPKEAHIIDMERALIDAAQERAIRKILGLPDGSVIVPSSK